jgi:RND family efflux transporter MFP subunit
VSREEPDAVNIRTRTGALAALALLAALAAGCQKDEAGPAEPVLRPVRYEVVSATAGGQSHTFTGVSRAGTQSTLSFKVGGTVAARPVSVGDAVAAGALIARLESDDFELKVREAEASLARAEAEARNADASYERVRGLYENQNASLSDLDAARAASESAAAQVRTVRNQLALARRQLSYTRLTAPEACRVAATYADVSENVGAGQRIALITCGEEMEVRLTVPESVIVQVRAGAPATVRCDALPEAAFEARVKEVGVAATGEGAAYPVTVRLLQTDPAIRPGMACEAAVRLAGAGAGIRVPSAAVAEDRQGTFVYVLEPGEDGTFRDGTGIVRRRAVSVGDLTDAGLAVTDGLAEGDRVVTAGVSRLEEGQRVRVTEGTGTGP